MLKNYEKPELKIHGDLKDITKSNSTSGEKMVDGQDMNGGAS